MSKRYACPSTLVLFVASSLFPACTDEDGAATGSRPPEDIPGDAPPPPLTAAELDTLADSEELQLRRYPWAFVPSCDDGRQVTMSDGVRLAIHLYYPAGFDPAKGRAPVVLIETWYGRDQEAFGEAIELYTSRGFVVVIQDSRGFWASEGAQPAYMGARVRLDQREVQEYLAAEPWTTGDVLTVGASISGTLAEFGNTSGSNVVRASVVRDADYDQYALNMFPGGVPNLNMLAGVVGFVQETLGEPCLEDVAACGEFGGAVLVSDTDFSAFRKALADHVDNADPETLVAAEFKDDGFGAGGWDDFDLTTRSAEIDEASIPTRITASWMDALTAESALWRYSATRSPVELVIGSAEHMGALECDPFVSEPFGVASPPPEESFGADVEFLERVLGGETIGRSIRYKVLGTDVWKTTATWPPPGVEQTVLHLAGDALAQEPGEKRETLDYVVDPNASTGPYNRWNAQMGGPVFYSDPRYGGRRLDFVSEPWQTDMELVGTAEVCVELATDQIDGIVIAYLEDVAPDGTRTYLTEGELRLIHRRTPSDACDGVAGTGRTFTRASRMPVLPGQSMRLEIELLPTAVRLQQGHRLRLSFAGVDAETFPMLTEVPASWTVSVGGDSKSALTLPLRTWAR